jgi:hypothetical protein
MNNKDASRDEIIDCISREIVPWRNILKIFKNSMLEIKFQYFLFRVTIAKSSSSLQIPDHLKSRCKTKTLLIPFLGGFSIPTVCLFLKLRLM